MHIYTYILVQTKRRHGAKGFKVKHMHRENINPLNKAAKKDYWGALWVESQSPRYFYVFSIRLTWLFQYDDVRTN